MHVAKSVLLLMSGAIVGIVFMISCGDNWHLAVDAAIDASTAADAVPSCNCPAVEPPLAGRLGLFSATQVVPGDYIFGQQRACPVGSLAIAGSCTTDVGTPIRDVTLLHAGTYDDPPSLWHCWFRNNEPTPVTIRATVLCLKPPS